MEAGQRGENRPFPLVLGQIEQGLILVTRSEVNWGGIRNEVQGLDIEPERKDAASR